MQSWRNIIRFFSISRTKSRTPKVLNDCLDNDSRSADDFLKDKDWGSSKEDFSKTDTFWQTQWAIIQKKKRIVRRREYALKMSLAAGVMLAAVGSVYFFIEKPEMKDHQFVQSESIKKRIFNSSGVPMTIILSDSSQVELYPDSEISYKEFFEIDKREISLKGIALFTVAKDSLRPFTVYTGDIATTAIGTRFKVDYMNTNKKAEVVLFEGRVVVRDYKMPKPKDYYLMPGDKLSYTNKGYAIKDNYSNEKTIIDPDNPSSETYINKKRLPEKMELENRKSSIPQWYKFEKESLANIFDQLSNMHMVRIEYNPNDIADSYFIGKFINDQKIDQVLKTIADLNNLIVVKTGDKSFRISKEN